MSILVVSDPDPQHWLVDMQGVIDSDFYIHYSIEWVIICDKIVYGQYEMAKKFVRYLE
jgi:hypothetical protein